jgi:hypothetical protein
MFKRKHRRQRALTRTAVVAAAGIAGTTAGIALASPASAATGIIPDATIAAVAKNAGLPSCRGVPLSTWVAIALAESGGNTYAHATVGEDSRGLWQINMRAHASWVGNANLYDPATNAWAAKHVCDGSGPSAWSTYTNGAYLRFVSRGQAAAAAAGSVVAPARTPAPATKSPAPAAPAAPATTVLPGSVLSYPAGYLSIAYSGYVRADTKAVQIRLNTLGYPLVVDGDFGPRTSAAVKAFQSAHGLVPDGIVGPLTYKALFF